MSVLLLWQPFELGVSQTEEKRCTFAVFVELESLGDVLECFAMVMFLLGQDGRPWSHRVASCPAS